jgi:hypothetical protein
MNIYIVTHKRYMEVSTHMSDDFLEIIQSKPVTKFTFHHSWTDTTLLENDVSVRLNLPNGGKVFNTTF